MTPKAFQELSAPEDRLSWLLDNSIDLPAQSRIAVQVARLVNLPNTSAKQVATALTTDQVLTAQVLKMANSAYYGSPRRISTVTDAIVLLGMRTIRDIAMAVSCHDLMEREVKGYALRKGDLWRHSYCCGVAAQQLAKSAKYHVSEEAFVAGLLHDIGKVVINHQLSAEFYAISELSRRADISYTAAERQVLGFDHAEIGAKMAERWNLPPQLVSTIRYHHSPGEEPDNTPLTLIVHLADVLCMMLGIGLGGDGLRYELQPGTLETLGIDENAIETVLSNLTEIAAHID